MMHNLPDSWIWLIPPRALPKGTDWESVYLPTPIILPKWLRTIVVRVWTRFSQLAG